MNQLSRRLFHFCCSAGLLFCMMPFAGCWHRDGGPRPVIGNAFPDTAMELRIDPTIKTIPDQGDFFNSIVINTTEVTVTVDGIQASFNNLADMRTYLIANSSLLKDKEMNVISGTNHNYKVLSDVTDILREIGIKQGGIFH